MGLTGRLIGAVAVLLWASLAGAAGFEFPDNGTQALGRGGAFTAKADDLSAVQYNIAGLAKLRGTHLLVNVNLAGVSSSFARSGVYPDDTYRLGGVESTQPWSGQPFPKVSNGAGPYPIPMGAVATDFGLRRFTFAFGVYGPSSVGKRSFPEEVTLPGGVVAPAPQRFDLLDEDIIIGYLTFAAAWQPLDWLYLGAAFQPSLAHVKEHVYAVTYTNANDCRNAEAWACSTKAGINLWDKFTATGIVSALVRPPRLEHLEIGASFRFPFGADASGSAEMSLPPAMSSFDISATHARLATKMPHVLRTGLRWFFGPREEEKGDVEVDVVWEGWSRVKTFESTFSTTLGSLDLDVPHQYRDTVSVRLGGAYNFQLGARHDQRLALRAGWYWESAAAPLAYSRLDFDAFARFGFTAGAGYTWHGLTFDAALAYIYVPTRTVTDGKVTPIYPEGFEAPTPAIINNGTYETRQWVVSLGAAVSFDELLRGRSGRR
jgi:long-subunit fatty acid transport protein